MTFENRADAGRQLAQVLERTLNLQYGTDWKNEILVVGLPRGGVPVALECARKFSCPLELIVSKKLPYPGQPEYAIGAVSSDGIVVLNPDIPDRPDWNSYIEQQRLRLLEQNLSVERKFYDLAACPKSSFDEKTVLVIDDGIATGMTAMAAVETARRRGARRVIMAAPVMSLESYHKLRVHCDDVIAVAVERDFGSVGQFFKDFEQTTNEEVITALREAAGFARGFANGARPIVGINHSGI